MRLHTNCQSCGGDDDDDDDDDGDDDDDDDDGDDDYITSQGGSKTGSRGSRPRLEPAQSFEKHENGPERGDTFGHQTIRLKMKAIKAQHYNMKSSTERYSAAVLKKCDTPEDGVTVSWVSAAPSSTHGGKC